MVNYYVDVSSVVADIDRHEANQAALTGDVFGDDDETIADDGSDSGDADD